MSELSQERYEELVETYHQLICTRQRATGDCVVKTGYEVADTLAPLIEGWLEEERERSRFNDEVRREQIRMARVEAWSVGWADGRLSMEREMGD